MYADLIARFHDVYHLGNAPVVHSVFGVDIGIEHVFLLDVVVLGQQVFVFHL
jgi:hypothetical protein